MLPTRLELDVSKLDDRLLWSSTQAVLFEAFQKLTRKSERLVGSSPIAVVTSDVNVAHLIAAFNLASAFSFEQTTLLIDATPKTALMRNVLHVKSTQIKSIFSISPSLAICGRPASAVFAADWHGNLDGVTADRVLTLLTIRDAFAVDWSKVHPSVHVIALAAPNEMGEARWTRLGELVNAQRLLGLWIVD